MKKIIAFAMALCTSMAQAADFTVSAGVSDGYVVGSGVRLVDTQFNDFGLRADFQNGFYAKIWAGLDGTDPYEIDMIAGRVFHPTDSLTVDLSLSYYEFPGVDGDVVSPTVRLDYQLTDSVNLYAATEGIFAVDGSGNDAITYVGASTNVPLSNRLNLSLDGRGGYDSIGGVDRWYTKVDVQPSFAISKDTSLNVLGVTAWFPEGDKAEYSIGLLELVHKF